MVLGARKLNRVFAAAPRTAVCHKLGTELPLAWRPASDIPPKLPLCAGYASLSPGVATPRARAPGGSSCLKKTRRSTAPLHAIDAKTHAREKVQTGEKIRAPEQRARSQQLP